MRGDAVFERIREAYKMMSQKASYRPIAPDLNDEELKDSNRLDAEATEYAAKFVEEEQSTFRMGISNYETNRALVYTIEAARRLCGADDRLALQLLRMASEEISDQSSVLRRES